MNYWSDSGLCGDHVSWELLGEVLYIDGEGQMDDYLPNASVWEPLAWLVRSVVIGKGVTSIGDHAFCGFTDLTAVSSPETVRSIGKGAFDGCAKLREITVARGNMRYHLWDGMLIDRSRPQIIWPPEKAGGPLGRFAVDENDCVFRIETGLRGSGDMSGIASFGDADTLIEIRECGGTIIDIECIYLKPTLHEPNLFLPDHRSDPELVETPYFYCPDYEYETRQPCLVNVVRDKMEIILSEKLDDISYYHTAGRVGYYCNGQLDVVFIRITGLSESEYDTLR